MCQAALAVKYILIRWLDYQSGPQIPASVVMQLAPSTLAACRVQLGSTAAGPPCPRPVCDSDPLVRRLPLQPTHALTDN